MKREDSRVYTLNVSEFTNNKITGTVNASKDATLICSIPYDNGWSVYIDGKKAETNDIYGALISVNVPAGEHTVTLKYMPVNFILGCIITSLCIIILIGIYTFKKMCRMNVIKTSDWPVLIQELIDEKDVVLTIHLDNFSLDELDDFDNLDSDESNNAD